MRVSRPPWCRLSSSLLSRHPSTGVLSALLDAELPPAFARRVEAHLASCDGCRQALDALRRAESAAAASLPPVRGRPPAAWSASVLRAVRLEGSLRSAPPTRPVLRPLPWVVAGLLLWAGLWQVLPELPALLAARAGDAWAALTAARLVLRFALRDLAGAWAAMAAVAVLSAFLTVVLGLLLSYLLAAPSGAEAEVKEETT